MDGVAARGLVNGRGPLRRSGRNEVGTRSDGTNPNLVYDCLFLFEYSLEGLLVLAVHILGYELLRCHSEEVME